MNSVRVWERDFPEVGKIPAHKVEPKHLFFCTLLAVSHVPLADAMHLMRHSDPKLIIKVYTDANQLGLAAALANLPSINLRLIEALS